MKKLIALFLILVITSFIVVSKEEMPLNSRIVIENNRNPNPKNKNWEYVKDRLFDGETESIYKLEGPILIDLSNATKQDSLAVEEIIKYLRIVLPNKKIDYFKNIIGKSSNEVLEEFLEEMSKVSGAKAIPLPDLLSSAKVLIFKDKIRHLDDEYSITKLADGNEIMRKIPFYDFRDKSRSSKHYFKFNKKISHDKRKQYIQYEILRSLCYINPSKQYPIHYNRRGIFETPDFTPEKSKLNELDKFLLQKLYSDDFIDQFKDYMYANYPWRYASSFINKKMHEIKVLGIIISLGILVFALIFSYFHNKKFKYSYLNYWFPIFLILIYVINLTNLYEYLTKFNSVIGWNSHILFQIPLAIVLSVIISFVLWGLEKISILENQSFSFQLMLKVIFTFISFFVILVIIFVIDSEKNDFIPHILFSAGLAIGRGLLLYLNHFSESLVKEKEVELSRLKEAKAGAEVKMLQSQINPHFLYNALNSIASLAHTDADKTEKMALSLSDLFRHSINQKEKKRNTLGDELSLVRNYLEIEQIRFGDRLKFSIDVEPDLLTVEIPMFMLQPLVENAIKHGVSKIEGLGEITLHILKKEKGVLISVQDNGPDFPEGLVSGHGLQTVYDLLRFSYGDQAEISWHNQPKKEITIFIDTVIQ